MDILTTWLFLAFVVERVTELLLNMFPGIRTLYEKAPDILALTLSILLALGAGLDFFGMFGIPFSIPYVGIILSGFFMSGGTKLVHDIIEWVGGKQQELKEDAYYM